MQTAVVLSDVRQWGQTLTLRLPAAQLFALSDVPHFACWDDRYASICINLTLTDLHCFLLYLENIRAALL